MMVQFFRADGLHLSESTKEPQKPKRKKKEKEDSLQVWMNYYLENYKKNELKETTYGSYREVYSKHIKDSKVGLMELQNLDGDLLQRFYNGKKDDGYNPKTIRHMYSLINSALEKAVQLKKIPENPNKFVVLPKKEVFNAKVLTAEEVKKILTEAKEDALYPIVVLTLYTGLRKGEVMALKWRNIDFEKKELHVEGSLCRVADISDDGTRHYDYKILDPKTKKSKRTIPLMEKAIEALEIQKERQLLLKQNNPTGYKDEDFVFARADGRYLGQRPFMRDYHEFLQKYGITDIRFHDLRHTFASLLLAAGESPKTIQELLGHSTITTTMDIYAHITLAGKASAIQKFEDLVDKKIDHDNES